MGNSFVNFLVSNQTDIYMNVFFSFFGVILGAFFSPKNNNVSNNSTINQSLAIINNSIHNYYNSPQKNSSKQSSDSNTDLWLWIIGFIVVAFLFVKYHDMLLDYNTAFIFMSITSTFTVSIKLYINNNFSNINKAWVTISFLIIATNIFTVTLMSKQNLGAVDTSSITNFMTISGIDNIAMFGYYAFGFILLQFLNILLLALQIHMYAVNSFLARNGRIAVFFVRRTRFFITIPYTNMAVLPIMCVISILFSSGVVFEWVYQGTLNNSTFLTDFINKNDK